MPASEGGNLRVVASGGSVKCPFCDGALNDVNVNLLVPNTGSTLPFGKRYIYSCPSCNKAIGISHRKGFWMG